MPPDERGAVFDDLMDSGMDLPFDADLESLDVELAAAGAQARRMLFGRSQPTRLYSNQLRGRLLETSRPSATTQPRETTSAVGEPANQRGPNREIQIRPSALTSNDVTAAAPGPSSVAQADPDTLRAVLALLTIAGMGVLLAVGALGGSIGSTLP